MSDRFDDLTRLGNGQAVDPLVAALWREARGEGEHFGDPGDAVAADAFTDWMRAPASDGGRYGVTRYLLAAYRSRPDLQAAFGNLDGDGGVGLVAWSREHGRRELLPSLLPAAPGEERLAGPAHLAVNVIGYLSESLGLAEAARLYIAGLTAAGVPVSTTAVPVDDPAAGSPARDGSRTYRDRTSEAVPVFNLACVNGDALASLVRARGPQLLGNRVTIGQWGWETDLLPSSWNPAKRLVDEVWVYSRFVAENLGRVLPVPVVVVPPAVVVPDITAIEPPGFARSDRFTFLFVFDLLSTERRKNVHGLIEAYMRAFSAADGARLLVKTINGRLRERQLAELRARAQGRSDVEIVDAYLSSSQKAALIASADCYVSLHRSEGFGLPLAEAMALGTPVIATGYSGNLDFTTPFNSYLVDWRPGKVGPGSEIYPEFGRWAEPDLDDAALQMRAVAAEPTSAQERASRAQREVRASFAPAAVGAVARARLEELFQARPS